MPTGLGNTGTMTHGSLAVAMDALVQQITGPGWNSATGDVTPLSNTVNFLRTKRVSGHLDPQPVSVTYFFDPSTAVSPTGTTTGTLDIFYPGEAVNKFTMVAGMTAFKMGDLIEDDVMVGECEFMLIGGALLDDTSDA